LRFVSSGGWTSSTGVGTGWLDPGCFKEAEGLAFTKEEVSHLSPYLTRYIRRFGEYVIDLEKIPDPLSEEVVSLDL
jgi:hypothetical protein